MWGRRGAHTSKKKPTAGPGDDVREVFHFLARALLHGYAVWQLAKPVRILGVPVALVYRLEDTLLRRDKARSRWGLKDPHMSFVCQEVAVTMLYTHVLSGQAYLQCCPASK